MGNRGLAGLVERVLPLHDKELVPVTREVEIPHGEVHSPNFSSKAQTEMGDRFELLNIGLYGGEHTGDRRVKYDDGTYSRVRPDITDKRRRIYWECKSSVAGSTCNLINHQIRAYQHLQIEKPGYRIWFAFYRHNVLGIRLRKRSGGELTEEMARGIFYSVVMPVSIVFVLHAEGQELGNDERSEFVYPYKGSAGYDPCTCIRSPILNRFFVKPEKVIKGIGLNIDDYRIQRYMCPESITLGGNVVAPFPIVHIIDRNHRRWVDKFIRKFPCSDDQVIENEGASLSEVPTDDIPI